MILPWKENDCWQMADPGCLRGFVVQSSWYICQQLLLPPPPPPPPSLANPPAPLPQCRAEFYPTTTQPNWTVYLDIGLLGNFPEGQVAGCRCTLLAGNSCISLAGSEEQIYVFPGNLPICLKWLRKGLFMLCCCFQLFLSKFPVG